MYVLPFLTTSVRNILRSNEYLTSCVRDTHIGTHMKCPILYKKIAMRGQILVKFRNRPIKFQENPFCFSEVVSGVQTDCNRCFLGMRTCLKYYKTKLKVNYICSICISIFSALIKHQEQRDL
jgi:hypothetical protein